MKAQITGNIITTLFFICLSLEAFGMCEESPEIQLDKSAVTLKSTYSEHNGILSIYAIYPNRMTYKNTALTSVQPMILSQVGREIVVNIPLSDEDSTDGNKVLMMSLPYAFDSGTYLVFLYKSEMICDSYQIRIMLTDIMKNAKKED